MIETVVSEKYDLRMQDEGWKDYLPSFMCYDRVVE